MSINPFDEIALEEALRLKERGSANEVVIVSVGGNDAQQQLRTGPRDGGGSRDSRPTPARRGSNR